MPVSVNAFAVGPIVGAVECDYARIFAALPSGELKRGEKRLWGRIRWRRAGLDQWQGTQRFRLNGNFDSSGVVILQELVPGQQYEFQAGWVTDEQQLDALDWDAVPMGAFVTGLPEQATTEFLFGSCCYRFTGLDGTIEDDRGDKIFRCLADVAAKHRPDFVLFGGDQVYADSTYRIGAASSTHQFYNLYRESFGQPALARLLRSHSHYMILDDHEIENNWPANADAHQWTAKYPAAIKAYQIYQASHSPAVPVNPSGCYLDRDPDAFWYTFSRGVADFFVMDVRIERVLSRWPWQRRMLGADQEQALTRWLKRDPDRVKVLVSPVVLFPEQRQPLRGKDAWEGFRHQRERIIKAIADSGCRKVLVLSGDVHSSLYARLTLKAGTTIHSWICSGLFWPTALMAFRWYRPMMKVPAVLRGGWGRELGQVRVPGELYSRNAFSRVVLSEQGASFLLYDHRGNKIEAASQSIRW